jgi:hypothetical protein
MIIADLTQSHVIVRLSAGQFAHPAHGHFRPPPAVRPRRIAGVRSAGPADDG